MGKTPTLQQKQMVEIEQIGRIRDARSVKNMAVMIVSGINLEGKREILAVEPMPEESAETYDTLF